MNKKTYRYFVMYSANKKGIGPSLGNAILVYDEPLDTQDMIERATKDIKSIDDYDTVIILYWKRIKDNRQ